MKLRAGFFSPFAEAQGWNKKFFLARFGRPLQKNSRARGETGYFFENLECIFCEKRG